MSSLDVICPHCGVRIGDPESRSVQAPTPGDAPPPPEFADLHLHLNGSGSGSHSGDQLGSSSSFALPAGLVVPDPVLGAIARIENKNSPVPDIGLPTAPSSSSTSGTFAALGALNLHASPAPAEPAPPPAEEGEDVVYVDAPHWPMLVLGSYASAATLALIWWVVIPRFQSRKPDLDGFVAGRPTATAGTRGDDHSRTVAPAPSIAAANLTRLGRALRVGALEITPIDVARQSVRLRRTPISGKPQERDGGAGAMALRVRVRNVSNDLVFAPIDPAFLRDADAEVSDSFVEIGPGDRVYLYPLPMDSEWSIVGQTFPELKPGEAKESLIVTEANFPATEGSTTWRIKVRTGVGKTATIGVEVPGGP